MVLGISPDSVTTLARFKEKQHLPFTLLADPDKSVAAAYGVKKMLGVARTTFLIGEDGTIRRVFESVKPKGHADEVLAAL